MFDRNEVWFKARSQYHYPLDQYWVTLPNLTLPGDAAYLMSPYAGEGVNMAMQDAFELADCSTNASDESSQIALAQAERQILNRASAVTQFTLEMRKLLHSNDATYQMAAIMNGQ